MTDPVVQLTRQAEQLQARLQRLERSHRRQSWLLGATVLLAAVGMLSRVSPPESIRAQRFIVIDADGVERGSFGVDRVSRDGGATTQPVPRARLQVRGGWSDPHSHVWLSPDGLFMGGAQGQLQAANTGLSMSSQKGAFSLGATGQGPGLFFSTGIAGVAGPEVRLGLFESIREEFVARAGAPRGGEVRQVRSVEPVLTFYGAAPEQVLWQVQGSRMRSEAP